MKTDDANQANSNEFRLPGSVPGNNVNGSEQQPLESGLRRDSPHFRPVAESVSSQGASAEQSTQPPDGHEVREPSPADREQLQFQATQLAEYLQGRLQELDRREAEFHAQVASWEQERRQSRSWIQQREQQVQEQQQQLTTDKGEICRQAAEMAIDQVAWEQDAAELKRTHKGAQESLQSMQTQLVLQQQQLDQSRDQLAEEQAEWALQQPCKEKQLTELADTLNRRQQQIEELEISLQDDAGHFEQVQEQYNREREELLAQQVHCHEVWQEQQQRQQRELQLAWEELTRRQVEVANREEDLKRLRTEVGARQHQVLEMHVAIEELCSQAEQETPGWQMPGWFSDIRKRLRQYHRSIGDEVIERELQLEQGARQLTEHRQGLAQQHRRLSRWAHHEQQRIDVRVARLATRERELARLEQQYQQQKKAWIERRRRQQRRLRQLLAA